MRPLEPRARLPRRIGMERRTIALLVLLVAVFGLWAIYMPKPTGFDDSWQCPTHGMASAWVCIKKPQ